MTRPCFDHLRSSLTSIFLNISTVQFALSAGVTGPCTSVGHEIGASHPITRTLISSPLPLHCHDTSRLLLLSSNGLSTSTTNLISTNLFTLTIPPRFPVKSEPRARKRERKRGRNVRSLGVLTPNPQSPMMPQTPMRSNLLQPLQIISHFLVNRVGQSVR